MKLKIINTKELTSFIVGVIMCPILAISSYSFLSIHFTNLPLTHKTTGYVLKPFGGKGLYDYYFLDINGDSIYDRGNLTGFDNKRKYKYGDTIEILYNPLQIKRAIPNNSLNKNIRNFSLLISIVLFIIFCVGLHNTYKNLRDAIEW